MVTVSSFATLDGGNFPWTADRFLGVASQWNETIFAYDNFLTITPFHPAAKSAASFGTTTLSAALTESNTPGVINAVVPVSDSLGLVLSSASYADYNEFNQHIRHYRSYINAVRVSGSTLTVGPTYTISWVDTDYDAPTNVGLQVPQDGYSLSASSARLTGFTHELDYAVSYWTVNVAVSSDVVSADTWVTLPGRPGVPFGTSFAMQVISGDQVTVQWHNNGAITAEASSWGSVSMLADVDEPVFVRAGLIAWIGTEGSTHYLYRSDGSQRTRDVVSTLERPSLAHWRGATPDGSLVLVRIKGDSVQAACCVVDAQSPLRWVYDWIDVAPVTISGIW